MGRLLSSLSVLGGICALTWSSAPAIPVNLRGEDPPHTKYFLVGGYGRSVLILGSEEKRTGYRIGLQYEVPDVRPRIAGMEARLILEGYFGDDDRAPLDDEATGHVRNAGVLAFLRYKKDLAGEQRIYLDIGWGIQYSTHISRDLDSHINSTPTVSLWYSAGDKSREWMLGIRFYHISNAGLVGNNQGQNQLYLMTGFRF